MMETFFIPLKDLKMSNDNLEPKNERQRSRWQTQGGVDISIPEFGIYKGMMISYEESVIADYVDKLIGEFNDWLDAQELTFLGPEESANGVHVGLSVTTSFVALKTEIKEKVEILKEQLIDLERDLADNRPNY